MTAVSSPRPLGQSAEIDSNQIFAKQSWDKVFSRVIYFGRYEPELASPTTEFVNAGDFPTIQMLALAASFADDMACLINSDIVVLPHLNKAIQDMNRLGGTCATSHRYEFVPGRSLDRAEVVDNGVDFFCAWPDLWKKVVQTVPRSLRIGHCFWDSWLLGFFNTVKPRAFFDLTKRRVIFHPRHESRHRAYEIPTIQDKFTDRCGFPVMRL